MTNTTNTERAKNFLVSTADFAYYVGGVLACTGTTNLNASLEATTEEQNVNAGKGNKLVYSFKYGRQLNAKLEAADWKLEYLAMASGSKIRESLTDVYKINERITISNGVGTLGCAPVGDVAAELPNGSIVTVTPDGSNIDLSAYGLTDDGAFVRATYRYNRIAKSIAIDTESTPMCGRLVLDADRHNNKLGKVGSVQIIIPSYQLNGSFNIELTPEGVTSTNLEGRALAVEDDSCQGAGVYAYIKEFDDTQSAVSVVEIAATPAAVSLDLTDRTSAVISVIGLKGSLYAPIELDNKNCTFTSDTPAAATVDANGVITAVASGSAKITVTYNDKSDEIDVTVM